ncbi:SDR family NAD(P)-dependent oxidoreductase [Streptomyces sp. NPDC029704]
MRTAPHPGTPCAPSPLPTNTALLDAIRPRIADPDRTRSRRHAERGTRLLRRVSAHAYAATLTELLPGSSPFTVDDVLAHGGVLPRHRHLIDLMAHVAERHGLLARTTTHQWHTTNTIAPWQTYAQTYLTRFPESVALIDLYSRMFRVLPQLLRGELDPTEALLADDGIERLEQFYDTVPYTRDRNLTLRDLVREMVHHWPADRPLHILEAGAGTGGTTAAVLPVLPPERTHYLFTDASPLPFPRAQARFAAHDHVRYRTFDLDHDPEEQDLTPGGFDLVIAANALHTAKDLTAALRRVHRLLAPGGRLLAVELHDAVLVAPLFGTMESFWSFTDRDLRPTTLMPPARRWPRLLTQCGFTDVLRADDGHPARDTTMSVLLAAVPTTDRRTGTSTTAPPSGPRPSGARPSVPPPSGSRPSGPRPSAPLPSGPPSPALPAPALPSPASDSTWIITGDPARDLPRAVAHALHTAGAHPTPTPATTDPDHWHHLLPTTGTATLVLLHDADDDPDPTDPATLLTRATRKAAVLRAVAIACDRLPDAVHVHLWLVTRPSGVLPVPEKPQAPLDAVPWGIARTLAHEHPRITVRRLSLERTDDPATDAHRLLREVLTPTDEDEICLTAHGRFVPRLTDVTDTPQGTTDRHHAPAHALTIRDPGLAHRPVWRETPPPAAPGPGEVVIAVRAAALNYKDVLHALGVLPAEPFPGTSHVPGPGLECSGIVTATGPGVTTVAPGDRVLALAPDALASHVRTVEHAVGRLPDTMTFTEAATLPVVFLTAHYGLGHLARLAPGETLLIHSAAGGVGLAALQYARLHGAHVIATAGTPAKRAFLHDLGVQHVLDSHSLAFADTIPTLTGGVDVVLNSLAGEAIPRGLETLRPGGRFIELGKRDIHQDNSLPLRPFDRNITFHAVDLPLLLHRPDQAATHFAQVTHHIRTGRYRPLPHTTYPAARITEAYRLLQHSRHIGKVVITVDPDDDPLTIERHQPPPTLDPTATYLVTGGLTGLGAATARHLAHRGARHLALVGRRGPHTPEAHQLLTDLTGLTDATGEGTTAHAHTADATDPTALQAIADQAAADGHPLRGIVHSAMHLDDAPLTDLTDERLRAVLAPKLAGAAALHHLTTHHPVDLFLTHSSAAATIGHLTQAPYVAGNLYLEALTRHRHAHGRPATTIAWGALGETGYVARNNLTRTLAQAGLEPLATAEALTALDDVLRGSPATVIGRFAWSPMVRLLPGLHAPRFTTLLPVLVDSAGQSRDDILAALAALPPDEALQSITDTLTTLLADVLQMPTDQLDPHRRLDQYGLDSLMGSELLVTVRQQFDIDVPPMEILRSNGTITDIARIVHTRLGLDRQHPEETAPPPP